MAENGTDNATADEERADTIAGNDSDTESDEVSTCIAIAASDVTFNGDGHTIDGGRPRVGVASRDRPIGVGPASTAPRRGDRRRSDADPVAENYRHGGEEDGERIDRPVQYRRKTDDAGDGPSPSKGPVEDDTDGGRYPHHQR